MRVSVGTTWLRKPQPGCPADDVNFTGSVRPFTVTVSVASPFPTAVTSPAASTVATGAAELTNAAFAVWSATTRPFSSSTTRSCCTRFGPDTETVGG